MCGKRSMTKAIFRSAQFLQATVFFEKITFVKLLIISANLPL